MIMSAMRSPIMMAVALVLTYLPILAIEVIIVAQYLWAKDFGPHDPSVEPVALADGVGDCA